MDKNYQSMNESEENMDSESEEESIGWNCEKIKKEY